MDKPPDPRIMTFFGFLSLGNANGSNLRSCWIWSLTDVTTPMSSLYCRTVVKNTSNNISKSCGPAMCSGWNWTLKKGFLLCMMPSFVWSLAFVNNTDQSEGRVLVSTAKPWFCVVMKQRFVPWWMHGMLWPLFPYLQGKTWIKWNCQCHGLKNSSQCH